MVGPTDPAVEFEGLDEAALEEVAARVAGVLEPGDVVVLSGEVGAGKTTFVRAAALALGVREQVTSPTYQLARGYEGEVGGRKIQINHLDLYRLEDIEDRDVLELDDYLDPGAVTFFEWAEPALGVFEDPTFIHISHQTPNARGVSLRGPATGRLTKCSSPC